MLWSMYLSIRLLSITALSSNPFRSAAQTVLEIAVAIAVHLSFGTRSLCLVKWIAEISRRDRW